jgi:NADPH:quinone reductase-like Zn-dependent oxidoreductase
VVRRRGDRRLQHAEADLVRSIGADRVVDYMREDFTARGERYDLIVDCHANHPLRACLRALTPTGNHVIVGAPGRGMFGPLRVALKAAMFKPFVKQNVAMMMARPCQADLALIGDLISAGTIKPVIDRRYPFRETAEAIRYLEAGDARGKVVITMS